MDTIFNILLVEDNPGDIRLTEEALKNGKIMHHLYLAKDGFEAMEFLNSDPSDSNSPRPDIILLDLNLPKKNGVEVLTDIKNAAHLRSIPVIILTTSQAEEDICKTYDLHANGYIVKPVDIDQFFSSIKNLKDFWLSVVRLPSDPNKQMGQN